MILSLLNLCSDLLYTYDMVKKLKVALVCDDLVQFGGAERVFMAFHEIWPDAPVYTTVASPKWIEVCRRDKIKLVTSFMQKLPWLEKLNITPPFYFICWLLKLLILVSLILL